ncbi:hypothetical protein CBS101457_005361 [Exobasidium rhododendri]|nr:hypothetical protein CBS101457_005361 [Exobasidium rhododendri]
MIKTWSPALRWVGCSSTSSRNLHTSTVCAKNRLHDLPEKVSLRTGPLGRLSKVINPRESSKITTRVGSSFGGNHSLEWCEVPRNILIVKKRHDVKSSQALSQAVQHIQKTYPSMNIIVEPDSYEQFGKEYANLVSAGPEEKHMLSSKVDLAVTLGGDGTILHVSSLFDQDAVPPVLSFSMGTLGFLLPYHIDSFEASFRDVIDSKVTLLLRMRLHQTTHEADGSLAQSADGRSSDIHLMNEVALHRGRSPHMTTIDAFVDGRHLTQAISDGLIIATPTGSTAYSLSAGGPIVHPSVQSLLLTPICPRSLSFRTVLLPSDSNIQLKVAKVSRSSADVIVDGRELQSLRPGQFLQVAMSPFPIPCINRTSNDGQTNRYGNGMSKKALLQQEPKLIEKTDEKATVQTQMAQSERGQDDWVRDINTLLRFNASFSGRGLLGGKGAYEENEDK